MFQLDVKSNYFYPVVVEFCGDGGKKIKKTFEAQFKRLDQEELKHLFDPENNQKLKDDELLDRVLVGWRDVKDEDGNDIEFNEVNRRKLMNLYPTQPATVQAFLTSIGLKGRRGN